MVLLLAACISLFRPYAAARVALIACLLIWVFLRPPPRTWCGPDSKDTRSSPPTAETSGMQLHRNTADDIAFLSSLCSRRYAVTLQLSASGKQKALSQAGFFRSVQRVNTDRPRNSRPRIVDSASFIIGRGPRQESTAHHAF